jgi:hypothetical protein
MSTSDGGSAQSSPLFEGYECLSEEVWAMVGVGTCEEVWVTAEEVGACILSEITGLGAGAECTAEGPALAGWDGGTRRMWSIAIFCWLLEGVGC